MILLFLAACIPVPDDDASALPEPVALTDASNYTLDLAVDVGVQGVDIEQSVDWSSFRRDLRGSAVDPAADVTQLDLVWLRDLNRRETEQAIIDGTLSQASVGMIATAWPDPGVTQVDYSTFDLYGTEFHPVEYFRLDTGTWMLRVQTADNADAMVTFLTPDDRGGVTEVSSDSASLSLSVDLSSLEPVRLGDTTRVSWAGLTADAKGLPWTPRAAEELWIARFDDATPEAIAAAFGAATRLTSEEWTLPVYGEHTVDLAAALNADGEPFAGVDDPDATWVLGLRCADCDTPVPAYLTLLEP